MELSATKQAILDAALELFSDGGFDAASMGQIAAAVGIRKSSLYSHFTGKEEILDTLIERITDEYEEQSPMSRSEHDGTLSPVEAVTKQVQEQVRFLLHDSHMSMIRRLLTIEQYRNPRMAEIQTEHVYTDVLEFNKQTVRELIAGSVLIDGDVEIMASQFAFPISAWISLCDRESEREDEVMELIEKHIRQFFTVYGKDAEK